MGLLLPYQSVLWERASFFVSTFPLALLLSPVFSLVRSFTVSMVNNRKAVKRKASAMATGQDMVAQGEGKTKRTPRSVGDEAANQAKYEVEAIVGKGLLKGGKVGYCVKWKGWDEKSNTYEPLSHLAEVTCLIKAFEKKE